MKKTEEKNGLKDSLLWLQMTYQLQASSPTPLPAPPPTLQTRKTELVIRTL